MPAKRKARAPPSATAKQSKRQNTGATSSVSASRRRPGLYDNTGKLLLAEASRTVGAKVKVLGQSVSLHMTGGDQTLVVTRWSRTDNRDTRCRATVERRAHELAARERDLEVTEQQVLAKMKEMAASHKDEAEFKRLNDEFIFLTKLKGHQDDEAAKLAPGMDAKVKYTEELVDESVSLPVGQLCSLPFFEQPVVFLHGPLQAMGVEREEKSVARVTALSEWGEWQATQIVGCFKRSFPAYGSGFGGVQRPKGVAFLSGELFVADQGNDRVVVFGRDGDFLRTFDIGDDMDDYCPFAIAAHGERLYITDPQHKRVFVTKLDGTSLFSFGEDADFSHPTGLAVSGDRIFVVDSDKNRVTVHLLDGTFVEAFGKNGKGDGEFSEPEGIAVADGRVFVADIDNHRVCVHLLDGTFERSFGTFGSGDGKLEEPNDVAAVGDRVFVADCHKVSVYKLDGTFVCAFGAVGAGDGRLNCPSGLAVDGRTLFVSDFNKHHICVFK